MRSKTLAFVALGAVGACHGPSAAPDDTDIAHGTYDVPQHPFLASNGASNIHDDGYMTDTYAWAGPTDLAAQQVVRASLGGECASVTFDAAGHLITVCISVTGSKELVSLDPHTLERVATFALPSGPGGTGFSGGGYFALDHQGRAVIPTSDGRVLTVALDESGGSFTLASELDLYADAVGEPLVADDGGIESVLPDWSGRLWFVTEAGAVGYVNPATALAKVLRLDGEAIGNSFAVDETGGVFVVSDHALYRFDVETDGAITTTWREAYDRGTQLKSGQVNFGSGTTPTLLDDDLIAITDNAEPRMNVLVYDRRPDASAPRLRCQVPVFDDGASATDNSLIGFERSFVVENNAGYGALTDVAGEGVTHRGISRVIVGESDCAVSWTAPIAAPSVVPKFSYATRLVYTYEKRAAGWDVVALDADDGAERSRAQVGAAFDANNNWAPVTIARDGTLYVGTVLGLSALVEAAP